MKKILALLILPLAINAQDKGWNNLLENPQEKMHLWKTDSFQKWTFEDGILSTSGGNSDLVTNESYTDFVLEFEFKVAPKGNSGIVYKVLEDPSNEALFQTYASGPEYQLIDDEGYPGELEEGQKTGANYALQAPSKKGLSKTPGEWNTGKIQVKNNVVKHWLNGTLVVEYIYGDEKWKERVAETKFAEWPYATPHAEGHIALQDHSDPVWFRKLRIKRL
ncbi:MAG: DUF1080 domain-containing protein [Cytophagales bacterium]|nr:DUF1080 domain-containing protein [Cytophagales bacterium]